MNYPQSAFTIIIIITKLMTNMNEQESWFSDILYFDSIIAETNDYGHWWVSCSGSVP